MLSGFSLYFNGRTSFISCRNTVTKATMHNNCYTATGMQMDIGHASWHHSNSVEDPGARPSSLASLFNDLSKSRAAAAAAAAPPQLDVSMIASSPSSVDYLGVHRFITGSGILPRSEDIVDFYDQQRRDLNQDDGDEDHHAVGGHHLERATHSGTISFSPSAFVCNGGIDSNQTPHIAGISSYPGKLSMMPLLRPIEESHTLPISNQHKEENANNQNAQDIDDDDGHDDDNEDNEDDEDGDEEDADTRHTAWTGPTMQTYPASTSMLFPGQVSNTEVTSTIACQDCGNQAKKDCAHRRCRTCCKTRGLECPTHIKSTWVPTYKRRQKTQLFSTTGGDISMSSYQVNSSIRVDSYAPEQGETTDGVAAVANSFTSTSTGTPPTNSDVSWLPQEYRSKRLLPSEARENAMFKCVKVTGINDGLEEYAYETMVKIGGRVYKGMLYDQGLDMHHPEAGIADLQLGGRASALSNVSIDFAGHLYGTSESVFTGSDHGAS